MSIFRTSGVGDFTRGGQTTIHFIRMILQVFLQFSRYMVVLYALAVVGMYFLMTDEIERSMTIAYAESWVKHEGLQLTDSTVLIALENGSERYVYASGILRSPEFMRSVNASWNAFFWAAAIGVIVAMVGGWIGIRFIYLTGRGFAEEEHIRGGKLVTAKELSKLVRKTTKTSGMTVSGIPIPRDSEPAHFLIVGSPGTGKSVTYREMMTVVRHRSQRAIVYDPSGELTENFYREGIDILMNPFDQRAVSWDIWCECTRDYEYDQLAASLIPDQNSSDPFWTMGARIVFSAIAQKMAVEGCRSNAELLRKVLNLSLEEIIEYLKGTEGAAIMSEGAEKMATSIRAVLATYCRPMRYLDDRGDKFSVRDWISRDAGDQWIFITAKDDQKEILRPLATAWINTASAAILSICPSRDRRVWLFLDELASLNKLPELMGTLAQSRKFGGCGVLGVQSYPQLVNIYGRDGADTIAGLCSTWAVFRFNEHRSAEWASKGLGDVEQLETNEGISYGVNDMRDGVSLGRQRQTRAIVIPTEIQFLPDLHGFLKLGRAFPVAKFMMKHRSLPVIAPGFVPRRNDRLPSPENMSVEDLGFGPLNINDVVPAEKKSGSSKVSYDEGIL